MEETEIEMKRRIYEREKAMRGLRKGLLAIFYLMFPFILAYIIWIAWMSPVTYWQKLVSLLGSIITIFITFYVEMEIT